MWGNNKTETAKKKKKKKEKKRKYTRTSRPKKGRKQLYKLTVTVRQTYVELENSNIIPQDTDTAQNHGQV